MVLITVVNTTVPYGATEAFQFKQPTDKHRQTTKYSRSLCNSTGNSPVRKRSVRQCHFAAVKTKLSSLTGPCKNIVMLVGIENGKTSFTLMFKTATQKRVFVLSTYEPHQTNKIEKPISLVLLNRDLKSNFLSGALNINYYYISS